MQKLTQSIIKSLNRDISSKSDMDGWFQMVLSRTKCWQSIINLALIVAEQWTYRKTRWYHLGVRASLYSC